MSFKIAVDAGHGLTTAGKNVVKKLDAAQTKEWVMNDRVTRHFIEAAKQYEGVEILRVDDPTGKTDVALATRVKKANDWGADLYFSNHHNAAKDDGSVFSGGGVVAFSYKEGGEAAKYRDEIYKACIAAGGLKGNRADPLLTANFYVLKNTKAPAVLMEYGFMDSTVDVPVIMQESYSKKMGYAAMEAIAKVKGLKKKASPVTQASTSTPGKIYRVQIGAFSVKENAEKQLAKAKATGFADAFIFEEEV